MGTGAGSGVAPALSGTFRVAAYVEGPRLKDNSQMWEGIGRWVNFWELEAS